MVQTADSLTASPNAGSTGKAAPSVAQRHRARARRDRIAALAYPIGMTVVLIFLWEAAARLFSFPPYLLPAPSAIISSSRHSRSCGSGVSSGSYGW